MRPVTAFLFMIATVIGAFHASADEHLVIKFSHVVSENTPKGQMALKFRDLVAEKTDGKVDVVIYPNSQLYGDDRVLEAMLKGDVHIAAPSLSKFTKYSAKLQIYDLPFLFQDREAVEKFQQSETGQSLLGSMEDKGIKGLGYLHNGMKQISSTKPVRIPADLKGQTVRIMESDVLNAQFEALGAKPLKKPFSEVFTLLQIKAIDAQENTWSNIYSKKFYDVQNYITVTNHGLLDYLVVTSSAFFESLPPALQETVRSAMDEAIAYGNKISQIKEIEDRQNIEATGKIDIIDLDEEERKDWVKAMRPVWAKFEAEIGRDIINKALEN